MPNAIHFEGADGAHVHEDCFDLPRMIQDVPFGETKLPQITSCWQFSAEELETLRTNGGVVYISLLGLQPPLTVSLEKPEVKTIDMDFISIATRLKNEFDTVRIIHHGTEGRIYLTFPDLQFDLSKDEWKHIENLYSEL